MRFTVNQWCRVSEIGLCASTDRARPILTGIQIEAANGRVDVVATDSYRLSHTWWAADTDDVTMLLPAQAVAETLRSYDRLAKSQNTPRPKKGKTLPIPHVEVTARGLRATVRFFAGSQTIQSHTLHQIDVGDRSYPKWRSLIKEPKVPTPPRPVEEFKRATRAEIVDYLDGRGFDGDTGGAIKKADLLETVRAIAEREPPADHAWINYKMLDALAKSGRADGDYMHALRIRVIDDLSPVRFASQADPNWLGLLMPVRVD